MLTDGIASEPIDPGRLLDLHGAVSYLEQLDPRRAAVVECRLLGGLDVDETAAAVSRTTVRRDWQLARSWLAEAIA